MRRIRLGVIGCGWISDVAHFPSIKEIPEAKLVAVADIVEEKAIRAARRYGANKWYTDHREMLRRKDLEAVIVLVPTHLHAEVIIDVAEAGKDVIVEKPITATLEEADEVIKRVERAGVKFMVAHNKRFNPRFTKFKELIEKGTIGDLVAVMIIERGSFFYPGAHMRWSLRPDIGNILENAVHWADLFRWYVNDDVKRVYTLSATVHYGIPSTDLAYISLKFRKGAFGTMMLSRAISPRPFPFNSALQAEGTKGYIETDDEFHHPILLHNEAGISTPTLVVMGEQAIYQGYKQEIEYFIECILKDETPHVTAMDARAALEIALAAKRSARIRKPVELPH